MSTWLFTCRHTFEETLCEELSGLSGVQRAAPVLPGLVRAQVDPKLAAAPDALQRLDPVYALQVLPNAQPVQAASIKGLAEGLLALAAPAFVDGLASWDVHALVPGQLKGTPKPLMQRRAELVAEAVVAGLRERHRRLSKLRTVSGQNPALLLQILLLDPGNAWVSVSSVQALPPAASWPSRLPAGLADVADDPIAPASSFRKLEEALACLGELPQPDATAVDLGASPGGWTRVMRKHGAQVTAVDRAALAPHLASDPGVQSVTGDAFAWRPPQQVDWLVSDIIAYPERVSELLDAWCSAQLARRFVVQMKFKRGPDWEELQRALETARSHGYFARAKHFFNDKNEVTVMGSLSN